MIRDQVVAAFRKAHPSGELAPVRRWDEEWIEKNSGALAQIPDQDGFWGRAVSASRPGETMEQIGTRALLDPAILHGHTNGKADAEKDRRRKEALEWVAQNGDKANARDAVLHANPNRPLGG